MTDKRRYFAAGALLLFILGAAGSIAAPAQQPPRPPEFKEIMIARNIPDLAARLKEFERIKAAYPESTMMALIDDSIHGIKIELCSSLDDVLALQKTVAGQGEGFEKIYSLYGAAMEIATHRNLPVFDKAGVVKAVLFYKDEAGKLLQDQAYVQSVPEDERPYLSEYAHEIQIGEAMSYLNAGEPEKAMNALNAYKSAGGAPEGMFWYTFAEAAGKLGKNADALLGYMDAAIENYEDAEAKAGDMWIKVNGKADGFDAALEAKRRELPYHPEEFAAPADWKGKAVLAEIFTGSECPPCAGADIGFDGLIESVPGKFLAILEYHLPIPRPDPIINPATKTRQQYYGVNSTPSTFFDGEAKAGGGGGRANAAEKYKEYLAEIKPRLSALPEARLTAKAARTGDEITVDVAIEKPVEGAEIFVVLVQKEVRFQGGNGIVFHKMAVRDLRVVAPDAPRAVFDLAASEKATDEYLTEFEKTYDRIPNYKFAKRCFQIDRNALQAVVFIQDKQTKKVHNAFSVDVK
ncbi:MAG: hypothetical protein NTW38_11945 [Candidatus Aminicenantes bacterium]|nr:hypothetical protein [Candidatus Aminicenantes bacterium]